MKRAAAKQNVKFLIIGSSLLFHEGIFSLWHLACKIRGIFLTTATLVDSDAWVGRYQTLANLCAALISGRNQLIRCLTALLLLGQDLEGINVVVFSTVAGPAMSHAWHHEQPY
jgi:hypothetical protein